MRNMSPNIEIIIGTYEEFLLGYKLDTKDTKYVITQTFADKSHSGSIKSLAVQGKWVATGAADDRIFIYDMAIRKQSQILLSHEGTVNSLAFTPDESHLLSCADDGQLIATRLKTWIKDATWKKAHMGSAVTHVVCHPSGKLALSLGADLVLRTWNLIKGRVAYKRNLKCRNTLGTQADCLTFSPNGNYFSLSGQRIVEIWSMMTADVVRTLKTKVKPVCICWLTDETCFIGLEDGKILWINVKENDENEILLEAHNTRVKAIVCHENFLITAASSGEIKIWEIDVSKRITKEIASTNIGCRPTCISVLNLDQFGNDYVIQSSKPNLEEKKPLKKEKQIKRGIVTIEYENAEEAEQDEEETAEAEENAEDSSNDAENGAEDSSSDLDEAENGNEAGSSDSDEAENVEEASSSDSDDAENGEEASSIDSDEAEDSDTLNNSENSDITEDSDEEETLAQKKPSPKTTKRKQDFHKVRSSAKKPKQK